ncbi:MAG: STAS domain-containing protein [Cyanobacteria bacterium P01_H01_bin.74]
MKILERHINGALVLDVFEENFVYPASNALKSYISKIFAENEKIPLVLNLKNINRMDSFGLAVLISVYKLCQEYQVNLAFCGLTEQTAHLIELTRMDRVMDIWDTEAQAIYQVCNS